MSTEDTAASVPLTDQSDDDTREELTASTLDGHARRIVTIVAMLNLVGMLLEIAVATVIGSASLLADAADFLEDLLINTVVLVALGWSVTGRRRASYLLAGLILLPAGAALATAVGRVIAATPPDGQVLSATAVVALVINAACAVCLVGLRHRQQALVRGAWLAARNDVLANILMVVAGIITVMWSSVWPDAIVGAVMALVNLRAAGEVLEAARAEDPALELDGD